MVSKLALNSGDQSWNPSDAYSFLCRIPMCLKRPTTYKKRSWLVQYKKDFKGSEILAKMNTKKGQQQARGRCLLSSSNRFESRLCTTSKFLYISKSAFLIVNV